MTKILLTGGSGFIAGHVLEQLINQGHTVVTTVRSESKAQKIRDSFKLQADRLEVVIVPDIAREDAFDEVAKTPGLEVVLHTASPFHFNWTDAQKELIDPALIGTTGILKAVKKFSPSVRRVVITSSFAAIVDETRVNDPSHTFSEASWNPDGLADIHRSPMSAYRVSKKLAERAAWDFIATEKPSWDLVTVCPPFVFGPVATSQWGENTSNERVIDLLRGHWKEKGIPSQMNAALWVDVRDVARAHIVAFEEARVGGMRLFTVAGSFCNKELLEAVRKNFPQLHERIPGPEVKGGEPIPADQMFKWDITKTEEVLGSNWIPFDQSIVDLVKSLQGNEQYEF